jgi:hypothetical protein
LNSEEQALLTAEIVKEEEIFTKILADIGLTREDFPAMVEIAKGIINPEGDEAIYVKNINDGQLCEQKIKDLKVNFIT